MKFWFHLLLLSSIVFLPLHANAEQGDKHLPELKKGAAVTAFTKEDGFKLRKKAIDNLGISFKTLKGNGPWIIPKSALVHVKHSVGVYRKWDDWITLVLVNVVSQMNETVTVTSLDLEEEDLIAVTGVLFLRMTDADLNSETVDSCAH